MTLNPNKLSWTAPTENEDGSPIDYELEYEVGLLKDNGTDHDFDPVATIPGQLREGDRYEAPIADMGLGAGDHLLALRSFAKGDPDRKSEWSESVAFRIAKVPAAPLDLRVA